MPTTTPLDPSDTLTPSPPHATIRVGDLIEMLHQEDVEAFVYVAYRVPPETEGAQLGDGSSARCIVGESDEVDLQPSSGLERRWYGGRKVVVVR